MSEPSPRGRRSGFPVVATVLVIVGIVLLLNNFGYLNWSVWGSLWRFWPIILVLIGINLVLGGRWPWLVFVITVGAVLGILGIGILTTGALATSRANASFSQPLGTLQKMEITVDLTYVEGGANPTVAYGEFTVEVKPAKGSSLTITRTIPAVVDDVIDLR